MLSRRVQLICFMLIGFIHLMHPNSAAAQRAIKYDTLMRVPVNPLYEKEFIWAIKQGKWGVLDSSKKVIVPCVYDIPYVVGEYYSRYCSEDYQVSNPVIMLRDSLADLVDLEHGVISPDSTRFLRFIDTLVVYQAANRKFGILDKSGHILIPPISEKCIYPVFDSLLLLYDDDNYCLYDRKNRVVVKPGDFDEVKLRAVINYFIRNGVYKNRFRFEFETEDIADQDLIPAVLYFEQHVKEASYSATGFSASGFLDGRFPETKILSLEDLLESYMDVTVDYCYVEGCFRYFTALIADTIDSYQVDLVCGQNIETSSDQPYQRIKGFGNGIIEFRNDALMASMLRIDLQIRHFNYYQFRGDSMVQLKLSDLFIPSNEAFRKMEAYIDSFKTEGLDESLIVMDPENLKITDSTTFSLDRDGIILWLNFFNEEKTGYSDDQLELFIPFDYLQAFIPENSLIAEMRRYFEEKH